MKLNQNQGKKDTDFLVYKMKECWTLTVINSQNERTLNTTQLHT